jgi:DNA polymerase-3 subunit delta'
MSSSILGHDEIAARFRLCIARNRLASVYLFVGPPGIGKGAFALALTKSLLCLNENQPPLESCGQCDSCRLIEADTHPDVLRVARPPDKSFIPVDLLIGDREHRLESGVAHHLSLKPYLGRRRIAVLDDADYLNEEGANCLLKTLEEPPGGSLLILLGSREQRQLPTIRSRCQVIRFAPLSVRDLRTILVREATADTDLPEELLQAAVGSLERAKSLLEPGVWDFRQRVYSQMATFPLDVIETIAAIHEFVERAGREPSARRVHLKLAIDFLTECLRGLMLVAAGGVPDDRAIERIWSGVARDALPDPDALARCLDRCQLALEQVDRNANLSTLVEAWLGDLARIQKTGQAVAGRS